MRVPRFLLFCAWLLAATHLPAATDDEVIARKTALDVAGAFSNDGYKLRDGSWVATLEAGKAQVIQVNLFAGNQYWFSVGATASDAKMTIAVFNETGQPIDVEEYQEGSTSAAGVSPEASGPYYVQIQEAEGAAATFCLLYSYK